MPPRTGLGANLGDYRLGVEWLSGFFYPLAESIGRTASCRFTPLTDDDRSRKSSKFASSSLTR